MLPTSEKNFLAANPIRSRLSILVSAKKVVLVLSAILVLPVAVIAGSMLEDEAYYESWEQSRTD